MKLLTARCASTIACALLLHACSPRTAGVSLDTEVTTPDVLISLVQQRSSRVQSMRGNGTLSFDSPAVSGTAWFSAMVKRPDSLLVQLEGPFGLDVGTFFLSRERYIVYNGLENRAVTGVPNEKAIRTVIPFDLTFDQLLNAFAGVFPLPSEARAPARYAIDEGRFFLSFDCGANTCDYWIDPEYLLVTKFQQRDSSGNIVVEASCSSLTEENNAAAPRRITVRFPMDNRRISISYSSVSLNTSDLSFAFSIPKNAETIVR